jgi:hypothetical protein
MLVDGARGLNVGGVRMGVGVWKVGVVVVRLFVLEVGRGGRRWVVQARTGDLA